MSNAFNILTKTERKIISGLIWIVFLSSIILYAIIGIIMNGGGILIVFKAMFTSFASIPGMILIAYTYNEMKKGEKPSISQYRKIFSAKWRIIADIKKETYISVYSVILCFLPVVILQVTILIFHTFIQVPKNLESLIIDNVYLVFIYLVLIIVVILLRNNNKSIVNGVNLLIKKVEEIHSLLSQEIK